MRALLAVLGVVGLIIVVAGAINHAATIRLDYLLGTSGSVSLFWPCLVIAAIIVLAGVAGVAIGRSAATDDRRKLETELEDTYKRLRAAQAEAERGASTATPREPATQIAAQAVEPATAIAPVPAGAVEPATAIAPVPAEAAEPATAVVLVPAEAETVITPPDDVAGTVAVAPPDAPGAAAAADETTTASPAVPEAGAAADSTTLPPVAGPAVQEAEGEDAETIRVRPHDPQTDASEPVTGPDAAGPV